MTDERSSDGTRHADHRFFSELFATLSDLFFQSADSEYVRDNDDDQRNDEGNDTAINDEELVVDQTLTVDEDVVRIEQPEHDHRRGEKDGDEPDQTDQKNNLRVLLARTNVQRIVNRQVTIDGDHHNVHDR